MKKTILGLILVLVCFNANAVFIIGYERPVAQASMALVKAHGLFEKANNVVLTLLTEDGRPHFLGFNLSYILGEKGDTPFFTPAFNTEKLEVVHQKIDGCGSVHYIANLKKTNDGAELPSLFPEGRSVTLELVDHSKRFCEDYKPYLWEATVTEVAGCFSQGTMELLGNPKPIYTPQTY